MSQNSVLPTRDQVPLEQTWALDRLFPSPAAWTAAYSELVEMLPGLAAFQGQLSQGPRVLTEFLDRYQRAGALMEKIKVYAENASNADTTDQEAAAREGQMRSLRAQFKSAAAFFNPELIAIGLPLVRTWIEATPELSLLGQTLNRLEALQAHTRSDEIEQVLALATDPFRAVETAYTLLNGADLAFKPATGSDGEQHELAQATIDSLIAHPDREVRRTAWENYADAYLRHKNTYAGLFIAYMKQCVFNMRTRGYRTCLQAALHADHIPESVFHNIIATFKANLPTWHRYWRLRRRALCYSDLHVYDIESPLAGSKPVVPYRQAVDWICNGLAPLGDEYVGILRRGCLEERWVDWARNKGKMDGAYSSGLYGTDPYILMSYADDMTSLSTLAHELGHSMHTYYTQTHQAYINCDYRSLIAEVASNFHQAMLREYLFRTYPERSFQIALMEEAMSNFHRYFFLMPTLARFELEVYTRLENDEPVSADVLIDLMADLFAEGYGGELAIDRQRIGITWAQFAHLYMAYYTFQYAGGISAAHALSKPILAGEADVAERYLAFLRTGDSLFQLDALRLAGVDLSTPEPVERAFAYLATLIDRLESLLL